MDLEAILCRTGVQLQNSQSSCSQVNYLCWIFISELLKTSVNILIVIWSKQNQKTTKHVFYEMYTTYIFLQKHPLRLHVYEDSYFSVIANSYIHIVWIDQQTWSILITTFQNCKAKFLQYYHSLKICRCTKLYAWYFLCIFTKTDGIYICCLNVWMFIFVVRVMYMLFCFTINEHKNSIIYHSNIVPSKVIYSIVLYWAGDE